MQIAEIYISEYDQTFRGIRLPQKAPFISGTVIEYDNFIVLLVEAQKSLQPWIIVYNGLVMSDNRVYSREK